MIEININITKFVLENTYRKHKLNELQSTTEVYGHLDTKFQPRCMYNKAGTKIFKEFYR